MLYELYMQCQLNHTAKLNHLLEADLWILEDRGQGGANKWSQKLLFELWAIFFLKFKVLILAEVKVGRMLHVLHLWQENISSARTGSSASKVRVRLHCGLSLVRKEWAPCFLLQQVSLWLPSLCSVMQIEITKKPYTWH